MHGPVTVRFDDHDRPLIDATTWVDAAAGLGWSVARHRRRQLDVLRRTAQGRLAEVLGPAAVTSDLRCRTLDLAGVAERCLELLPEDQRQLLEAFAHGVSAGLDPADEPWRPLDSISVAQLLFDQLSFDGGEHRMVEVLDRTLPRAVVDFLLTADDDYATDLDGRPAPPVGSELPLAELRALVEASGDGDPARLVVRELRATGSNAWAVSDGETATLASDMHLALTVPALWYAAVLRVGDRTVTGVTVPGLPVIVAGTNQRVAWGFTRLAADTADLVELRPGRTPDSFRDPSGGDRPFDTRVETIAVL
ncbi:penicillin acylase family protein, partial [Actinosynnema sp. NPDC023658]|uniref:penicillin acylase family protein n=1 Tax=Actinosynnema sp. NPDC023658 TaxID=3155465 RepID=UPI0033CC6E8E